MKSEVRRPFSVSVLFALAGALFVLLTLLTAHVFALLSRGGSTPAWASSDLPVIIIDPGHGGADGGAVGSTAVEKELNLDIGARVADLFRLAGYEVVMTRGEDIMLSDPAVTSSKKASDLSARLKIAKQYDNAIFLSIHMNAFTDSRYSGLQVYYSVSDSRSLGIAGAIQELSRELDPKNTRKVKAAGENIYLLHKLTCPAVLIECGFLSNDEECARLADAEYRKQLSLVFFAAVSDYICENY